MHFTFRKGHLKFSSEDEQRTLTSISSFTNFLHEDPKQKRK